MTFEEWKETRLLNGIYWGDLKAAWDASRNAALDEAAQLADDFFQGNSVNEGEVIYCSNIAMEIRNVLKDKS